MSKVYILGKLSKYQKKHPFFLDEGEAEKAKGPLGERRAKEPRTPRPGVRRGFRERRERELFSNLLETAVVKHDSCSVRHAHDQFSCFP